MKKIIVYFVVFLLSSFSLYAQQKKDTLQLYFDVGKWDLKTDEQAKVNYFLTKNNKAEFSHVYVEGHADITGNRKKNIKLSEKRTLEVVSFLEKLNIDKEIISFNFHGDSLPSRNKTSQDNYLQFDRRVIVVVEQNSPKNEVIKEKGDTCLQDTSFLLPNGSIAIMNRCEYWERINCIEFVEYNNPRDILDSNISLMTNERELLQSCGMIQIRTKDNCPEDCFKKPVKILFPIISNDCLTCGRAPIPIWVLGRNGRFGKLSNKNIKKVKYKGQNYYSLEMKCPNMTLNCDCLIKASKTVIKLADRRLRLESVSIFAECPRIAATWETKPKRRIKIELPCAESIFVRANIIDKRNATAFKLLDTPLSEMKFRAAFSKCKPSNGKVVKKWAGIFPVRYRNVYRKYIITSGDNLIKSE